MATALPNALPMFPLQVAMLPGEELPLRVFEPRYTALVQDCLAAEDPVFGVVLIAAGREVGGGDERCDVGALARIAECEDFGNGRYRLRCLLGERIRVLNWLPDDPYPRAAVEPWADDPGDAVPAEAVAAVEDRIIALFQRIATASDVEAPDRDVVLSGKSQDTGRWLYALASRVPMGQADRYSVLSAPTVSGRLAALGDGVDTVAAMVEFQLSE